MSDSQITFRVEKHLGDRRPDGRGFDQASRPGRSYQELTVDGQAELDEVRQSEYDERHGQASLAPARGVPDDPHPVAADPVLEALWAGVDLELRRCVTDGIYWIWLAGLHVHRLAGDTLVVGCHPRHRDWLEDRFANLVATAAGYPIGFVPCLAERASR